MVEEWSRHPDKTRDTFTATGFYGGYPAAVLRDWVQKLGMGFCTAHLILRSASVCISCFIIFNYLIIPLITCKWASINFQILYFSPNLIISSFSCNFGYWSIHSHTSSIIHNKTTKTKIINQTNIIKSTHRKRGRRNELQLNYMQDK